MDKIIANTNLNINTFLINLGLMTGYLHDEIIESTTFGRFNLWFGFVLCIFHGIKWTILIFSSQDPDMANFLGEWAYFFGPKVIYDFLIIILTIYIIVIKILFIFASKHPKKMYWLKIIELNPDKRSFDKMNLNETESKMFIKRLSISFSLIKFVIFSFVIFSCWMCINLILFSYYKFRFDQIHSSIKSFIQNGKLNVINRRKEKQLIKLIDEHKSLSNEIYKLNLMLHRSAFVTSIVFTTVRIIYIFLLIYFYNNIFVDIMMIVGFLLLFLFGFGLTYLFSRQIKSAHQSNKLIYTILCRFNMRLSFRFKVNQ